MDLNSYYNQRISDFSDKEKECLIAERKLPFLRLLTIVIGLIAFYFLFHVNLIAAILVLFISFIIFFIIVKKDFRNSAIKKEYQLLKLLNEKELESLNNIYSFADDGSRYKDESHPYSGDLDIFGDSSIYHYINRTTLSKSSDTLADWLLIPADNHEIEERNKAIAELCEKIEWRQKIFILGYSLKEENKNALNNLIKWVRKTDKFSFTKRHILLLPILSCITLATIVFSFFFSITPLLLLLFIIHFAIIYKANKFVKYAHIEVTNNSNLLVTYADILREIEKEGYSSNKLNALKDLLKIDENFASTEVEKLSKIVNSFDIRYNVLVHFFLNSFLFWDIHQVYKLEKWKKSNQNLEQWFHCVAEFETLSSFANLYFNNPEWCFPKINNNHFNFNATNLGHPLINAKTRVCNNFAVDKAGKIILLSGSNMSGKSTFLRAVGVNIILAMAGSCVCAADFTLSPVRVLSSMRISDSLKDNTSSFFAELKKLETIIKIVENNEKVFLLLDEILRGTNSTDRHIGSSALIKQLIRNNAVGIVATHDLSLTDMIQDYPENIENYNFNIKINNEDLYFDYLLNKGVCTSLNASLLMKKMGINI